MILRDYQQQAVDACYRFLSEKNGNPVIVCPTGAGKSIILAQISNDAVSRWNGRVLILAHVKELLEQNADKVRHYLDDDLVGIYSAGLKQHDMHQPVIAASIQSIYKRACEFEPFNLIIIDECHLLPASGDGMYRKFLKDALTINPKLRIIGTTATAFRMESGLICGPDNILNDICYEIGVKELILQGYLCPLKSKSGKHKADTSHLHIRGGEFINSEIADLMDNESLVHSACHEIAAETKNRNSVLIFAASVEHAQHVKEKIQRSAGQEVGLVTGDTPAGQRDEIIQRFKGESIASDLFGATKGPLKFLVNVNVLTTGFDAPNIDCIVLLRPTNSPGLYYQCVGRGFRLHPDKENCLVLDFGGNILRHGPVDAIQIKDHSRDGNNGDAPAKECPECQALIHAGYSLCPECGFEFPKNNRNHEATASTEGVLSGEVTDTEFEVSGVLFYEHIKRNADENTKPTLRVEYRLGLGHYESEWICFEHTGYARHKAEQWWLARSKEPIPDTVWQALDLANAGALAETYSITVRSISGQKFNRIIGYDLGPKPPLLDGSEEREDAFMPDYQYEYDSELPF
jgi:DNA repair protein RadD